MLFINRQNISNKIIYIILFLIAFGATFTSTFNPLNVRRMHIDSSVYVTIVQEITRGQLPYRDCVDNKGPLLYLLSVPGFFLGRFTGIWITEIILIFISTLFAYKTALFFGDKYKAMLGTVFSFIILHLSFYVNAGTEEYSFPFLTISFYIFTKFYFSPKREVRFFELIVLGFCFSCAVLIRLNMFPLWAGFCIVIFIESIIKRRFVLLGKYIAGFCLGIIIVLVPVFFYLQLNGIADAFIYQVIFRGTARAFGKSDLKHTIKSFYIVISRSFSILPLVLGLFLAITKFKQREWGFYAGYTFSYFLTVLFLAIPNGAEHYNMVLIPYFIPALVFLTGILHSAFSMFKTRKVILVFFFCLVFSEGLIKYLYDLSKIINDKSGSQLINAGKMIDENTKPGDKIISLGYNGYIYPFTQRDIVSKYCYQGWDIDLIPGARGEFISGIMSNKPAIIALFTAEDGTGIGQLMPDWHNPIFEMMEKDYRLLSDENGFRLFIKND